MDEQWVFTSLALSRPLSGGTANDERMDRAVRGLMRKEAAGMRAAVLEGMLDLPGGAGGLPLGADRLTWVIAKIAKGMCFADYDGKVLGPDTQWTVRNWYYDQIIAIDFHNSSWEVADVLFAKGAAIYDHMKLVWPKARADEPKRGTVERSPQ
jgi:hypothetical protein